MAGLTFERPVRRAAAAALPAPRTAAAATAHLAMWAVMLWHISVPHADSLASLGAVGACFGVAAVAAVGVRRGRAAWHHVLVDGLFMAGALAVGVVIGGPAGHGAHAHGSGPDMSAPAVLVVAGVWALVRHYSRPRDRLGAARRLVTALPMLVMFAWMIVAH